MESPASWSGGTLEAEDGIDLSTECAAVVVAVAEVEG